MNTRLSYALCLVAVGLLRMDLAFADPAEAEDTAYRMAKKYTEKGFAMAPTDHSGVCGGGTAIEFLIPVNKGLDYVFLVGTDLAARDVQDLLLGRHVSSAAGHGARWPPPVRDARAG